MMERVVLLGYPPVDGATAPIPWMNGARAATAGAMTAILRYGSSDRYDLFVPHRLPESMESYLSQLKSQGVDTQRVSLIPFDQIHRTLKTRRYLAVHDPGSCQLGRLAAMVRPLALEATPCTCTHHSISYGHLLPHFLEACVSGLSRFDAIFCSSTDSRAALHRLLENLCLVVGWEPGSWRHRLELAPLGIDVPALEPQLPRAVARRLLGLPVGGRYVLYLGRLTPFDKADLDVLLRSFATLRHTPGGQDLQLLLAGDDTNHYGTYLIARAQILGIAHAVRILSTITKTTKQLVLWSADVFVSPVDSIQESFGLAVLEAMAAGLPVVASDWGGYRDLVNEGITGFLIPTTWGPCTSVVETQTELGLFLADHLILGQSVAVDEDALTLRLQTLLNNPTLRATMGQQAREHASQYDWPVITARYEAVWRDLKREALATGEARRPPVRFPFWSVFGAYATRRLQPRDIVELRQVVMPAPPVPPQLEFLLPEYVLKRLQSAVVEEPQPVDALVHSEEDLFGLLWLAKAGVIRVHPVLPPSIDKDPGFRAAQEPPDGSCGMALL